MVRDVNISGNLYHTLGSITAVGNDLGLVEIGGCGKGQTNIRSSLGAPHILVDGVVVGGR
jgi:TldD protein